VARSKTELGRDLETDLEKNNFNTFDFQIFSSCVQNHLRNILVISRINQVNNRIKDMISIK
jgi:hypothetical protein